MEERKLFGNTLRAVLAAGLLTAGCEVAPRSGPAPVPSPTPRATEVPKIPSPPAPSPERRPGEFRWIKATPVGQAEVILPLGRLRPDEGIFVHAIDPALLKKALRGDQRVLDERIRLEGSLNLWVEIRPEENNVYLRASVGHVDEQGFRSSQEFEGEGMAKSPFFVILRWRDWRFYQVDWRKGEWPPKKKDESILISSEKALR